MLFLKALRILGPLEIKPPLSLPSDEVSRPQGAQQGRKQPMHVPVVTSEETITLSILVSLVCTVLHIL